MIENFAEDFSWIGIAFFYGVAFAIAFGQIWSVNREIKRDKEKAAADEKPDQSSEH